MALGKIIKQKRLHNLINIIVYVHLIAINVLDVLFGFLKSIVPSPVYTGGATMSYDLHYVTIFNQLYFLFTLIDYFLLDFSWFGILLDTSFICCFKCCCFTHFLGAVFHF